MVKIIVATNKINCDHLLGKYLDESHYDILIEEDTDCYMPATCDLLEKASCEKECSACEKGSDEKRIAFKFRKNFFTEEEQKTAYLGLREAATESQNRGLAAGPRGEILAVDGRGGRDWVRDYELEMLDFLMDDSTRIIEDRSIESIRKKYSNSLDAKDETRGQVWLRNKVCEVYPEYHGWFDKWVDGLSNKSKEEIIKESRFIAEKWISTTNYAKSVYSGVAGWYDRYPRIPFGRATSYTRDKFDKFKMSFPFLQSLNRGFKELLPWRWSNQKQASSKIDDRFLVPGTVFTTITVNKNFRTAAHLDAGDYSEGLSNLLVISNGGNYKGGYLVFPEYRIAVNVRPGDLLLVNNHEIIHGNTEIELLDPEAERISLVCYLREGMLNLGSYEYEKTREEFIEQRRKNKNHPLWRPLWNGVSPGWETTKEWYDFLESKLGQEVLYKYHPEAKPISSLENFFE